MWLTLVMYDDDNESFWPNGFDKHGVTEAMVKYYFGTIEQSGYSRDKITFRQIRSQALPRLSQPQQLPEAAKPAPLSVLYEHLKVTV